MMTFELRAYQDSDHQLMFKQNGEIINIVYFDRAQVDGDGYISLYLSERYVSIVNVQNNQDLVDELTKLAN